VTDVRSCSIDEDLVMSSDTPTPEPTEPATVDAEPGTIGDPIAPDPPELDAEAGAGLVDEVLPNPADGVFDGIVHEPGVAKPDPILVADGIVRTFGGLTAVDVEHAEFQRGAITAIIGPNGAGKTTFFNLLTGFDDPDRGSTKLDGNMVSGRPPHTLARLGMVRTFQLTKSLARLTVLENVMLGGRDDGTAGARESERIGRHGPGRDRASSESEGVHRHVHVGRGLKPSSGRRPRTPKMPCPLVQWRVYDCAIS
jgi:hypothetical protein